jgi:hypothetical protein
MKRTRTRGIEHAKYNVRDACILRRRAVPGTAFSDRTANYKQKIYIRNSLSPIQL